MKTAGTPAESVILHGVNETNPSPDDADTLLQVRAIGTALRNCGYRVRELAVGLDLQPLTALAQEPALIVFNIVESLAGRGSLLHLPPAVLEMLGIPFTGSSAMTLALTTDKPLSKRLLRAANLPTPDWWEDTLPPSNRQVIVKPSHEDGSLGINAASVMPGSRYAERGQDPSGITLFAEAYVDGREFNVSLLANNDETGSAVDVLPVAEIRFIDFPADRPRILDYEAKWLPESAAYRGTVRHTLAADEETALVQQLGAIAQQVWTLFNMRGFARVDFRVDAEGNPWIVDINANPCLTPDAGFAAAAAAAGLTYDEVIRRIVADALRNMQRTI